MRWEEWRRSANERCQAYFKYEVHRLARSHGGAKPQRRVRDEGIQSVTRLMSAAASASRGRNQMSHGKPSVLHQRLFVSAAALSRDSEQPGQPAHREEISRSRSAAPYR